MSTRSKNVPECGQILSSPRPSAWALRGAQLGHPSDIRQNLVAGVVVGIIALPLSIALAVAVGVSPISGLYTAVFAGVVAAIFGGSSFNITGPTAALVPVLAHAVLLYGPQALPMLGLMAGVLLLLMSLVHAGRLIRYVPGTVVVGFTAGIALSIAFGQVNNLLAISGTDPSVERFHEKVADSVRHLGSVSLTAAAVGALALAVLIAWPRLPRVRAVPGPLVAVALTTVVSWAFGLDVPTIGSTYGDLPGGLPSPSLAFFDMQLMIDLLPLAAAVAVLGGIESLLSAVVADGMSASPQRHRPDAELRGQGLGNVASSLFGGIPATAAVARTGAGVRNGATNRLTGVFHALTVLLATILLGGLAEHVPLTALAAVLLVIAWNIGEAPQVLHLFARAPKADSVVLAGTLLITLFLDLTYAIAFGVLASAVLLLYRLTRVPAVQELLPDTSGRIRSVTPELSELMKSRPDLAFFSAEGQLSFHSAAAFEYELKGQDRNPLILRMKDVHHVDTTGLLTLEGIIEHRQKNGQRIILTAIQPDLRPVLDRFGIIKRLGPENVFEHTRCAIASIDAPHGREAHPGPSSANTSV